MFLSASFKKSLSASSLSALSLLSFSSFSAYAASLKAFASVMARITS